MMTLVELWLVDCVDVKLDNAMVLKNGGKKA